MTEGTDSKYTNQTQTNIGIVHSASHPSTLVSSNNTPTNSNQRHGK